MYLIRNKSLLGNVAGSMHVIESEDFASSWKVSEQPALSVQLDRPGDGREQVRQEVDR